MRPPVTCTLALAVALSSSCSLVNVRRENTRLAALSELDGTVSAASWAPEQAVVVVLLREDGRAEEVESTVVLYRPGPFHFWAERGRYQVFAFTDVNRNLTFDEGEPAGWYGKPTQVQVSEGTVMGGLDVAVGTEVASRHWSYRPRHDQVVKLADEAVGTAMGKKGMWAPGDFREVNGDDSLYLMEPFDPNKVPIVFVHGIGGCPSDMQTLIESLDRTRFQPWLFWYASGKRLSISAQSLRSKLDEFRVLHDFSKVIVVAQSAGGLVARDAVAMLQDRDRHFVVDSLITLSTPWNGHSKANYGVEISLLVVPAWWDMVPNSPFVQRLVTTPMPDVRHYLFFSYGADGDNDDGSVSLSSELELNMQRRATEIIGFPVSHMGIITNVDAVARFSEVVSAAGARSPALTSTH